MDPLLLLARDDKFFLGGGRGAIYAPPFPRFLLSPGFWDECFFADLKISRLFGLLVSDASGRPIRLSGRHAGWRPDRLIIDHTGAGTAIRETRFVTEANAWVCELELLSETPVWIFQWSLLDLRPPGYGAPWQSLEEVEVVDGGIRARWDTAWPSDLEPDRTAVESEQIAVEGRAMRPPLSLHLAFGASANRLSWTVNLAQRHDESLLWETSLLPQKLRNGRLPQEVKHRVGTEPQEGLVHLVQQYELRRGEPLRVACGAGLSPGAASASLAMALREDALARNEASWRRFFGGVPQFECSDPYLNAAYWYRWYGIRLNTVDVPDLPVDQGSARFSSYVTEGIGFFRNFVTYSAQAHLREVSWRHDPSLAVGILDNLGACQRNDGSFPGHNYSCRPARDFYHADFASPLEQIHALHPQAIGKEHLGTLRRYADYLVRNRTLSSDLAGPTLYDVFDQNETGQEYMSRYQFASEDADKWASFRVHGVDATVYAVRLFEVLDRFRAGSSPYGAFAEGGKRGLREIAFDPDDGFYCDVRLDGKRSWARPLTGLYPLMLDETRCDLKKWLPEFDLPAGFPATAHSDPTFSSDGEWKERRLNCPWNGRSWPMANSHLVDAVAKAARGEAGPIVMKAIRMLFHDGDPTRPNSYEHYDPIAGTPALYRGYDDYMHSWIVDLILRHVVGVRPGYDEVDPVPLDLEWLECREIPHPRGRMAVRIERGKPPAVSIPR
ncbi:MAG TPA: hypothetical protein VGE01_09950 [Fimbriimonas sp.]